MIHRYRHIITLLILFTLPLLIQHAWAGKVKTLKLNQLTENAYTIFEGKCIKVKSGRDPETGLMATWYTFQVLDGIKGQMDEEFVLKQYGGTDGEITVNVPTVKYREGEIVILFLYGKSKIGFSSPVGLQQGKFVERENSETGARYVTNGMPAMMLFEDMNKAVPTVNTKGVKLSGAARLRSDKMALKDFLLEVKRLVKEQEEKEKEAKK